MNKHFITQKIKQKAFELGFSFVGISKAEFLEKEARNLEKWLNNNHHGKMAYMENYFDKRTDPRLLVDDAKSVITVLCNYYTKKKQEDRKAPKISKYAFGKDYHLVIREKLNQLHTFIIEEVGEVNARGFVDSAPVMDKAWAERSGLGWIGKNANLINKESGSYFFIGELIIDLELETDGPIEDYCGTCTRCIDACPTDAIIQPYVVDGSKCISYLTIELKDEILPKEFSGKMQNWMFGCDVCQQVCPWNKFSLQHNEPSFEPNLKLLKLTKKQWNELSKETFNELFKKSAVKRTKFDGLKRNIKFLNI
ncbi:MAG: tRNA epoxyqueuosine(34) reductase QueG [Crocinitomicaceae bacterium]|nr:tRNA epoxyqueuosine(34) reductase QueG [Crocinitomicaceae bacterium]